VTVPLTQAAGQPALLRFNYSVEEGFFDSNSTSGAGWYIDDILLADTACAGSSLSNTTLSTNFTFVPETAGDYLLQARPLLYGEFPLEWGPPLHVVATALPSDPILVLHPPMLDTNTVEIEFTVVSGELSGSCELWFTIELPGLWQRDLDAVLSLGTGPGRYRFTAARAPLARFYRVKAW
jgi:hypothetical protein